MTRPTHALAHTVMLTVALSSTLAMAQQTRSQAQGEGLSMGKSLLNSGPLTPAAQASTATRQGSQNVWGPAYQGQADPDQTSRATSGTLFGVGNDARAKANAGFDGFSNTRERQANEAVHFLDRNPVLKPNLSPQDTLFSTTTLKPPAEFASSTHKVCKQETVHTTLTGQEAYHCIQSFDPYVITCSTVTQVVSTGSKLQCENKSFSCIPNSSRCCSISITCNSVNNSATIAYKDCCGYQFTTHVADADQLRNGLTINPAGANLRCNASGACVENFADYYCDNPTESIGYYPGVNAFSLGLKKLFGTTQTNNCGPLEGLAAP